MSIPSAQVNCVASGPVIFGLGVSDSRGSSSKAPELAASGGCGLTLLTPTRYMFGVTVHRRLSTDTHMSPLAGRLCLMATRQRYLQGPKLSLLIRKGLHPQTLLTVRKFQQFQLNKMLYCHLLETCHNNVDSLLWNPHTEQ